MWFTKLEFGNLILAPRPRYSIEKVSYKPNLSNNGACVTCGDSPIEDWDIVFTIHCLGNGDLSAARLFYNQLVAAAKLACTTERQRLVLQYCNELPMEHDITKAYIVPVEQQWQPDCCDSATLSVELHMTGLEISTTDPTELVIYNYLVYNP